MLELGFGVVAGGLVAGLVAHKWPGLFTNIDTQISAGVSAELARLNTITSNTVGKVANTVTTAAANTVTTAANTVAKV